MTPKKQAIIDAIESKLSAIASRTSSFRSKLSREKAGMSGKCCLCKQDREPGASFTRGWARGSGAHVNAEFHLDCAEKWVMALE